jgi:hypothetical protein
MEGLVKQSSRNQINLDEDTIKARQEVAQSLRNMRETAGWKLIEEWLTKSLNVAGLIFEEDEEAQKNMRIRARVCAELLTWVETYSQDPPDTSQTAEVKNAQRKRPNPPE